MPVPKEMDRHIIKYMIGERTMAVQADPTLLQRVPWDHSDVFYDSRTWLNQHGWDTSVYNDNISGGTDRRKAFYDMIKSVCENFYHVKRHQVGIYPDDRAIMAYEGVIYSANFDNLRRLMGKGTDVVCVEKGGTVVKMTPFTKNNGVAFIQSQGFISEYGTALARLCNQQSGVASDYTDGYIPKHKGHLGTLTDCDSSGVNIGLKIKGAIRLGIDLGTIEEINEVNKGLGDELGIDLPIELEDLEESTRINSHWRGLKGVLLGTGKLHKELSVLERRHCRDYLLARPKILSREIRVIDYLEEHRIELNTVLSIIKPQAFWNWLRWKMLQIWPSRNYLRGGLGLWDSIQTPTKKRFDDFYGKHIESVTKSRLEEERSQMLVVKGMYDDTDGFRDNTKIVNRAIMGDVVNEVVLPDKKVQELDLALENIMKNGNAADGGNGGVANNKHAYSQRELAAAEDSEEFDDDYDGNEWDD